MGGSFVLFLSPRPPQLDHFLAAAEDLLKKLDYPCSEAVLASAALIDDEGYELTGSRVDFEMLAGFVAGDANHSRAGRRQDNLHDIAEALENALAARAYAR